MQTFLPYSNFEKSAQSLDNKRLNKQIVEVQQIIKAIQDPEYGWQNHPAVNMWRNHLPALFSYGLCCYREWRIRKNKPCVIHKSGEFIEKESLFYSTIIYPDWIGNEAFHRTHQSNLIRKDKEYYGPQFPGVPDNLEYIWPK